MNRIKISIRSMLISIACIAAATCWLSPLASSNITRTANSMDVAIDGSGYFRVLDEEKGEIRYTRNGTLEVDSNQILNIRIEEQIWPIEPAITVPSNTTQLDVSRDGRIRAHTSVGRTIIGRFQLAYFGSKLPFDQPFNANIANDRSGMETSREPSAEDGWLIQGSIERPPCDSLTIATTYTIALFASCVFSYLARKITGVRALRSHPST
ncbi:hypothetical protein AB1K70_15930 [Bremerella sp. JC770]|uniref:hypothetical protein n=1 Tax=Bremerella sp. JC770 TaxID=3232137 RepID=UPI00345A199E